MPWHGLATWVMLDPDVAAPARHANLSGLPPSWLGVGSLDLFHDETLAYAARLRDAGVPVQLDVVPGAFHGFDLIAPRKPIARRFFDGQRAVLQSAFTSASPTGTLQAEAP